MCPSCSKNAPHKVINRKRGAQGFEVMVNCRGLNQFDEVCNFHHTVIEVNSDFWDNIGPTCSGSLTILLGPLSGRLITGGSSFKHHHRCFPASEAREPLLLPKTLQLSSASSDLSSRI